MTCLTTTTERRAALTAKAKLAQRTLTATATLICTIPTTAKVITTESGYLLITEFNLQITAE